MNLRPVDWDMQSQMRELYLRYSPHCSALHFSTLYLWQQEMQISVLLESDFFAVHAEWRGPDAWFFPCGSRDAVQRFLNHLSECPTAQLCYADEAAVALAGEILPGRFVFDHAPQDDEYLYDISQQLALRGGAFRHQRNDLNRIQHMRGISCRALSEETLKDAFFVLDGWGAKKNSATADGLIGADAARRFLEAFGRLDATGVLVYQDGEPVCLAAGYPLTHECFDLALCIQTSADYGFSVYARQQLCARLAKSFRILNAEEDLGLPGLRTLKQGMRPCSILKMYEGKPHGAFTSDH